MKKDKPNKKGEQMTKNKGWEKEFEKKFVAGEDWLVQVYPYKVKTFIRQTIAQELRGLVMEEKYKLPEPPKREEDMDFHWNTGDHLYRCTYCHFAFTNTVDDWTKCNCSEWDEDIGKWKRWLKEPKKRDYGTYNQAVKQINTKINQRLKEEK